MFEDRSNSACNKPDFAALRPTSYIVVENWSAWVMKAYLWDRCLFSLVQTCYVPLKCIILTICDLSFKEKDDGSKRDNPL